MQRLFGAFLKKSPPEETEIYELKFTNGSSISFSKIKTHQIEALKQAKEKSLYHKITDLPWGLTKKFRFASKKPFDCFCLVKTRAFIVVWFYKPRKEKIFIKITIDKFLKMMNNTNRKSFTEEMALEAGQKLYIN